MKVLVTGGAGFIGSHVVDALLERGHEVIALDNFDPYYDPNIKRENIAGALGNEDFRLVEGDVRDGELLKDVIKRGGVECVIHEAAQAGVRPSIKEPLRVSEVNVLGTLNVLQACVDSGVGKIVNASSSSVYGKVEHLPFDEEHPNNPLSPYGASKLVVEQYCKVFAELYDLRVTSLRYFTVYGPRMRPDLAISIFTAKALRGEPLEVYGDGSKTRDFTYISDAVDATLKAMDKGDGQVLNVGGGSRISIGELAQKIISLTGSDSKIMYSEDVKGDAWHTWADVDKAGRVLGWKPEVNLDDGLKKYLEWVRGNISTK